jgi:hypothetical protein
MYDDDDGKSTFIFFLILVPTIFIFLLGSVLGYDNGKNTTTKYCIESPKECKIQYDYLKLQGIIK